MHRKTFFTKRPVQKMFHSTLYLTPTKSSTTVLNQWKSFHYLNSASIGQRNFVEYSYSGKKKVKMPWPPSNKQTLRQQPVVISGQRFSCTFPDQFHYVPFSDCSFTDPIFLHYKLHFSRLHSALPCDTISGPEALTPPFSPSDHEWRLSHPMTHVTVNQPVNVARNVLNGKRHAIMLFPLLYD